MIIVKDIEEVSTQTIIGRDPDGPVDILAVLPGRILSQIRLEFHRTRIKVVV
jgi:hypothetical protein